MNKKEMLRPEIDMIQNEKYKNNLKFYSLYKKRSNISILIYLLLLALFFFSKPW